MTPARSKFIDFDARRNPKTSFWCVCCQRDLRGRQKPRFVFVDERMEAVHPEDLSARGRLNGDIGWQLLGLDCARRLGLEWSLSDGDPLPVPYKQGEPVWSRDAKAAVVKILTEGEQK